jgi:hypothetical protein
MDGQARNLAAPNSTRNVRGTFHGEPESRRPLGLRLAALGGVDGREGDP